MRTRFIVQCFIYIIIIFSSTTMTIHQKIIDEFKVYVKKHPGKPCGGPYKHEFIRDQLNPVYDMLGLKLPDDSAQDKQGRTKLDRFVSSGMAIARGVIIRKVRMHKLGAENACSGKRRKLSYAKYNKKNNPKNNPKNGKKNRKKRKDANDEETRIWLKNHPTLSEHVLEKVKLKLKPCVSCVNHLIN